MRRKLRSYLSVSEAVGLCKGSRGAFSPEECRLSDSSAAKPMPTTSAGIKVINRRRGTLWSKRTSATVLR